MFNLRKARLFALDFDYLELLPDFYYNVERPNPKIVPCQKASGCTGPVTVMLKGGDYYVNEGVRYKLEQNRSEYSIVISEAAVPPPLSMTSATVHIENSIKVLIRTTNWNSVNISGAPNSQAQILLEIGTDLFYTMISLMDEDIRAYPPTNSFIGSCIDVLGREFIYDNHLHCSTLLETIMRNPQMIDVLSPLFRPSCAPVDQFISMYSDISNFIQTKDMNLLFTLLTKFDFVHWLANSQTRPNERSAIISIIGQVIINIGIYPDEDQLIIYDIYRLHMRTLLLNRFPEHYREFLQILLKGSETQSLTESLWYDIMSFLGAEIHLDKSRCLKSSNFQEMCRAFSSKQTLLTVCEMEDTMQLLASHFMKTRVTSPDATQKGLYSHYRPYVSPIGLFTSLIAHSIIADKSSNRHSQPLQQVLEKVWKDVLSVFAPWILPITSEQSTCLPWIETDKNLAKFMMSRFTECVAFINEMFSVPKSSLSLLWNLYATTYAQASGTEHIVSVCHHCFINLPWNMTFLTLEDVQLMVKHECVSFMGQIFIQVHWGNVINFYSQMNAKYELYLLHTDILQLFLKLSFEESIIQTGVMPSILADARNFYWSLVKYEDYDLVLSWFVDNCDPLCVLVQDTSQTEIMRISTMTLFTALNVIVLDIN
ncbi:Ectopic P granules protein 5 [Nymphon striatum]|nr:Ectopic P granules protein 5 [Nymphon striatum]